MPKTLEEITASIEELPTLQQVAVRLLQIIDNPRSTVQDVNRVVTQDPALASKILKLVNSSYVGLTNKVSSLKQAIVHLGFNLIKGMALSVSVFDVLTETLPGDEKFRRDYWLHSITAAALARQVATAAGGVDPEVSFVMGLLHDIGKMVLDAYAHDEWRQIMDKMRAERIAFHQSEKTILSTDHAEIGGWLAKTWGLNDDLVEGIRNHHRESLWRTKRIDCAAQIANLVSRLVQEGDVRDAVEDSRVKRVAAILGTKPKDLLALAQSAREELKKAAAFLDVLGE